MTDIQLRIRIDDDDDLDAADAAASDLPVELQHAPAAPTGDVDAQIAPIAAVLIGAGVLASAKFITDWWEARKGGLVIDQRADAEDDIYRDKDVPYGFVVVFPKDGGEVKVDVKDAPKVAVERWISEVISGAYKSVTDIAKAVAAKPDDDKIELADQAES